jgi:carbonyl reductase 1
MNSKPVAVILGGTRGIGLALAAALGKAFAGRGEVILTARRQADGERAVAELATRGVTVSALPFDLADAASPATLAALLRERHGGVDVVVQNGAAMPRAGVPPAEDARPMIEANSHGTLRTLRAFLPLLRENGRMVVVASGFGVLSSLPEALRERFVTTDANPDRIDAEADAYVAAVEAGTAQAEGWPEWVNIPSKVAQVAVTRAFARQAATSGRLPHGALINAACPGVTLTDATRDFMGTVFKREDAQTPEQAAEGLMGLLTRPAGSQEPYAELVRHGRVIPFGD